MSDLLNTAIKAAHAAGDIILQNFGDRTHTFKDDARANVVTATDIAAEQAIFDILKTEHPDHGFFSEEAGHAPSPSAYTWVIDPLDGTTNFIHGIRFVCVSIALQHESDVLLGVIYDPLHQELFTAELNAGAACNHQPIRVGATAELLQTVLSINRSPEQKSRRRFSESLSHLTANTRTPRIIGSVALSLAYVACGRIDAFVGFETKYYDAAAGTLIAREAGAAISDFADRAWQPGIAKSADLLVANKTIHPQLRQRLTAA